MTYDIYRTRSFLVHFLLSSASFSDRQVSAQWKISAKVAGSTNSGASNKSTLNYETLAWSYDSRIANGPARWHERYPECGWKHQSPVNIQEKLAGRQFCDSFKTLEFSGYNKAFFGSFSISGALAIFVPEKHEMTISGNFLAKKYVLEKVVFHWGRIGDSGGSDHQINGRRFAFEMQLFHKPADTAWELSERVVISVLANPHPVHNAHLQSVIDGLVQLATTKDFVEIRPPVTLDRLMPRRKSFYMYHGSYPFPPCTEEVTWVVFDHPIGISRSQLAELRSMFTVYPVLKYNNRPVQPLNDRLVETRGCVRQMFPGRDSFHEKDSSAHKNQKIGGGSKSHSRSHLPEQTSTVSTKQVLPTERSTYIAISETGPRRKVNGGYHVNLIDNLHVYIFCSILVTISVKFGS